LFHQGCVRNKLETVVSEIETVVSPSDGCLEEEEEEEEETVVSRKKANGN